MKNKLQKGILQKPPPMFKLTVILVLMILNVIPAPAREKKADWICEAADAGWQPRDSQGEYVFNDHLWIMGGWVDPKKPNLLDGWKSPDGKSWIRVIENAPWVQSDLPVSLVFKNRMWLMGGRKLPGTECSNKVWSSTDGADWKLVMPDAGWSPRMAPGFTVFKNRMWVLGGTGDFYKDTLLNDIWSSKNGRRWKLETRNAGWPKRAYCQTIVFDNKMWILGGGQHVRGSETTSRNDVWCSENGVNWTHVTDAAPWKPRLWFSSVVYRGRMWILGGWSRENGNFGDVWYSKDGVTWTELKSDVKWPKRHEHSAFVFEDRIWIAGGCTDDYILTNDVWSLFIPEEWFGNE